MSCDKPFMAMARRERNRPVKYCSVGCMKNSTDNKEVTVKRLMKKVQVKDSGCHK